MKDAVRDLDEPATRGISPVDVTVLGLVGGAPGGETPRVADSSPPTAQEKIMPRNLGIELLRRVLRRLLVQRRELQ